MSVSGIKKLWANLYGDNPNPDIPNTIQYDNLKGQFESTSERLNSALENVRTLRSTNALMEYNISTKAIAEQRLRDELQAVIKERTELESRVSDLCNGLDFVDTERKHMASDFEKQLQESREELASSKKATEAAIDKEAMLNVEMGTLQGCHEEAVQMGIELAKRLQETCEELSSLKDKHELAINMELSLKKKLQQSEEELASMTQKHQVAVNREVDLENRVKKARENLSSLKAKHDETTNRERKLAKRLEERNDALSSLRAIHDETINRGVRDLFKAKQGESRAKADVGRFKAEVERYKLDLEQYNMNPTSPSNINASLADALETIKKELEDTKLQYGMLKTKYFDLKCNNKRYKQDIKDIQVAVSIAKSQFVKSGKWHNAEDCSKKVHNAIKAFDDASSHHFDHLRSNINDVRLRK